jgi:hypothetical protein
VGGCREKLVVHRTTTWGPFGGPFWHIPVCLVNVRQGLTLPGLGVILSVDDARADAG